jgi:hypothetical protein
VLIVPSAALPPTVPSTSQVTARFVTVPVTVAVNVVTCDVVTAARAGLIATTAVPPVPPDVLEAPLLDPVELPLVEPLVDPLELVLEAPELDVLAVVPLEPPPPPQAASATAVMSVPSMRRPKPRPGRIFGVIESSGNSRLRMANIRSPDLAREAYATA